MILLVSSLSFALEPDRFVLGTGNDLFSMGLSRNDDDQLSFSLNSEIGFGNTSLFVDYDSITNRGWKSGWDVRNENKTSSDSFYNGRFDELRITGSQVFDFSSDKFFLRIKPSVGLAIIGNLGSEELQNSLHKVLSIHNVKIPYESSVASVKPLAALEMSALFAKHAFKTGVSVQGTVIPSVKASEIVWLDSYLYEFNFALGYRTAQCWSKSKTDKLYSDYLNGMVLRLGLENTLISAEYTSNLSTGYGFGKLGINIAKLFSKEEPESTVGFSLGLKKSLGRSFKTVDVNFDINEVLSVGLSDSFIAGDPVDPKQESLADLSTTPRIKLNNAFLLAGVNFHPNWDRIKPYAGIFAGVYKTEKTKLFTTVRDSSVPCRTLEKKVSFCSEIKTGVQLYITRKLGIDLFAGLSFIKSNPIDTFYGFSLMCR